MMMWNKLENIDHEDLGDLLLKVEESFQIRFLDSEIPKGMSFGELSDLIVSKIKLNQAEDCTTQQAFYKLREAISSTLELDRNQITPTSELTHLFARKQRRLSVARLEGHLGVKLGVLTPPAWLTLVLIVIFFAAVLSFIFDWRLAIPGIVFSLAGLWIAEKRANEFSVKTLGDLAEEMTRTHYIKSRRNPDTVNKNEIESLLAKWFRDELILKEGKFTRASRISA